MLLLVQFLNANSEVRQHYFDVINQIIYIFYQFFVFSLFIKYEKGIQTFCNEQRLILTLNYTYSIRIVRVIYEITIDLVKINFL